MGELQVADVRAQVALSLMTDFENYSVFKPNPAHEATLKTIGKPIPLAVTVNIADVAHSF
jgi:hypothetical protein